MYPSMWRNTLLLLCLFIHWTAAVWGETGVPQTSKTCNFKTDYPLPDIDRKKYSFEMILISKNGSQLSCYNTEDMNTIVLRSTTTTNENPLIIRELLIGLPKSSFANRPSRPVIPTGITPLANICPGKQLYSHNWILKSSSYTFKFNLTAADNVTFNATVVFSYKMYIEDKTFTFHACPQPTPTPSPSPSLTPSSSPSPSLTPSPTPLNECPICNEEIVGLTCPKTAPKITMVTNHTDEDGTLYSCSASVRIFNFPTNCTHQLYCKIAPESQCADHTVSIGNCSVNEENRYRKHQCTSYTTPSHVKEIRFKIPIQRDVNYKCDSSLVKDNSIDESLLVNSS